MRRLISGIIGVILVGAAGAGIALIGHNNPVLLDQPWHDLLAALRSGFADRLAELMNFVGGTVNMTIITATIVAILVVKRRRRAALALASSVVLATALSELVKALIARPRPLDAFIDLGANSFPSGHATVAAAFSIALALAIPTTGTRIFAIVWIAVMAWSRNYLLVHWLSDVLAGAVLGASAAYIVAGTIQLVTRQRQAHANSEPALDTIAQLH